MFAVALLVAAMLPSADPQPTRHEFAVGDDKREALVYVPKAADKPAPVVFAFHGHGGSMKQAAAKFGYHTLWPEAVCVYMQGLPTPGQLTDPEGKKAGWQASAGKQDDRDLKFFDAVLAWLKKEHTIDEKRVYCTGHSNGGGFTYLLWAERPGVFAAVAPAAAGGRAALKVKPLPCLHVAGEKDPLVKFAMQEATMNVVRKANGCEADGKPWEKAGELVGTVYESKGGTPFVSLIGPGGHEFPDGAAKLIVKFFQQHEKAEEKR